MNTIEIMDWEGVKINGACLAMNDKELYLFLRDIYFINQPNARKHLIWFFVRMGDIYIEDVATLFAENPRIKIRIAWLIDKQIQSQYIKNGTNLIQGSIIGGADGDKDPTHKIVPIRQYDYDSEDWRNANGNMDEVHWKVIGSYDPYVSNTFEIRVKDPYVWHPDDATRSTQCIHQAMDRLIKNYGASNYITEGTARVVLPSTRAQIRRG